MCNNDCHCDEIPVNTVTLELDNGETLECAILTIYEAGENMYIALLPLDENGDASGDDVYIYRYTEVEGQDPVLDNIEGDDEYLLASGVFGDWLDSLDEE